MPRRLPRTICGSAGWRRQAEEKRAPRPKPGRSISVRDEDSAALLGGCLLGWGFVAASWRVLLGWGFLGGCLLGWGSSWLPSWRVPSWLGSSCCLLGGCLLGWGFFAAFLAGRSSWGCASSPPSLLPRRGPPWRFDSAWGADSRSCRSTVPTERSLHRCRRSSSKRCTTKSRVSPTATASRARRGPDRRGAEAEDRPRRHRLGRTRRGSRTTRRLP